MKGACDCCGAEDLELSEFKVWAAYDFAVTEDQALAVDPEPHGIHNICEACRATGAARATFVGNGARGRAKVLAAIAWSHNETQATIHRRFNHVIALLEAGLGR